MRTPRRAAAPAAKPKQQSVGELTHQLVKLKIKHGNREAEVVASGWLGIIALVVVLAMVGAAVIATKASAGSVQPGSALMIERGGGAVTHRPCSWQYRC